MGVFQMEAHFAVYNSCVGPLAMLRPSCAFRLSSTLFFSIVLPLTIGAQPSDQASSRMEETWSAACSAKIERPVYPTAAIGSKATESVTTDLTVDTGGKPTSVALSGPVILIDAIRTAIDATVFPAACKGRRLSVKFSFKTTLDLPAQYFVSVCFVHPPNTFWVTANAIQIGCSHYAYTAALVEPGGMTPVTVCELLANPMAYNGKNVALLGRADNSNFDGSWVSQDNCTTKVITDGYIWPNQVAAGASGSGPAPPLGILVLDPDGLSRKLESVRRTTSLNMVKESFYSNDGGGTRLSKQEWTVIFGRIEAQKQLRPPSGTFLNRDWGNGFGQMNASPAQIIYTQENQFNILETAPGK
jgi:hypothetical protein